MMIEQIWTRCMRWLMAEASAASLRGVALPEVSPAELVDLALAAMTFPPHGVSEADLWAQACVSGMVGSSWDPIVGAQLADEFVQSSRSCAERIDALRAEVP